MHRTHGTRVGLLALAGVFGATAFHATPARAAAEWIYRGLTLPRGVVAFDVGLGYGQEPVDPNRSTGGFGMNLELAGGVTHDLELGLRTGVRLDDGGQATEADRYARTYDTETFGTGHDRMANPELRLRWLVARGAVVQLGLEGRAYLPFESHTRFGVMFGVPLALRLGTVRFDTGLYVPILFYDPTRSFVSVPLHVWIQASPTFWLGPLLGLRIDNPGGHTEYPFGFGLGWALGHQVDLRGWFLFPDLNQDRAARTFGFGVGLQVRFE